MIRSLNRISIVMFTRAKSKYFQEDNIQEVNLEVKNQEQSKKTKIAKRNKKHLTVQSKIENDNWQPLNWIEMLNNIKEMRKNRDAPVDSMGAEQCYDKECALDKDKRFQILVSLMLSSQTKDQVTHEVMLRLRKDGLNVDRILKMSINELESKIKTVGFWKRKAEYIKKVAVILNEKYQNDIPNTLESLLELPGVGPKMSHLAMKIAWNQTTGISVDTHVHRLCNRFGWVRKPTKTPEETRVELESWLPKEHWDDINLILVGFGQSICKPVSPQCRNCFNNKICPSSTISF